MQTVDVLAQYVGAIKNKIYGGGGKIRKSVMVYQVTHLTRSVPGNLAGVVHVRGRTDESRWLAIAQS